MLGGTLAPYGTLAPNSATTTELNTFTTSERHRNNEFTDTQIATIVTPAIFPAQQVNANANETLIRKRTKNKTLSHQTFPIN